MNFRNFSHDFCNYFKSGHYKKFDEHVVAYEVIFLMNMFTTERSSPDHAHKFTIQEQAIGWEKKETCINRPEFGQNLHCR